MWGLSTALILSLVIYLNGRGIRFGWLLGAAVQLINVAFGYFVYGQSTFLFLGFPAEMFLANWWSHPRRKTDRPAQCSSRYHYTLYPDPVRCSLFAGHRDQGIDAYQDHLAIWVHPGEIEMSWIAWGEEMSLTNGKDQ